MLSDLCVGVDTKLYNHKKYLKLMNDTNAKKKHTDTKLNKETRTHQKNDTEKYNKEVRECG